MEVICFLNYLGGVLSPNCRIYCIFATSRRVGTIKTGVPKLSPWMMAPEFNKFYFYY